MATEYLVHGKVRLALHALREGTGHPLLLLHGLGERSPSPLPRELSSWSGPIYALDFTGHGESSVPQGGGYTAEVLMADADAALARLGRATLVGRGLGAYVALLLAGGRPEAVRGAILRDGPGLHGGGPRPGTPIVAAVDPEAVVPPDPFAVAELSRDVRPPDYASSFARQAAQLSGLEQPITVCAIGRPAWLRAVLDEPGVEESPIDAALATYASVPRA
jgi:pimeloyl-ACP methyl ester carboxylesterase